MPTDAVIFLTRLQRIAPATSLARSLSMLVAGRGSSPLPFRTSKGLTLDSEIRLGSRLN
jgi:hypothetical protein